MVMILPREKSVSHKNDQPGYEQSSLGGVVFTHLYTYSQKKTYPQREHTHLSLSQPCNSLPHTLFQEFRNGQ